MDEVVAVKKGYLGEFECDECKGKTGFVYVMKKDDGHEQICTSCRSFRSFAKTDPKLAKHLKSYLNRKAG